MSRIWVTIASAAIAVQVHTAELTSVELINERCSTCHGTQGHATSPIFPSLAAQNQDYLIKQLKDFKSKKRVSEIMTPQVADLSAERIVELAAFFSAKSAKVNRVSDEDLLPVGRYIYNKGNSWSDLPACANCHGEKPTAQQPYRALQDKMRVIF